MKDPRLAQPEHSLQRQTAKFLGLQYRGLLAWHTPNGGLRDAKEAAMMKGEGVAAGVPDWSFALPSGRAAFVELKTTKGHLSAEQRGFRDTAEGHGIPYAVARSLEDFQAILRDWKDRGLMQAAEVFERRNVNGTVFPWKTLLASLADHVRTYVDPQFWTLEDADRLDALAAEVRRRAEKAAAERRKAGQ